MTYQLDKLLPCLPEQRVALLGLFADSMRFINDHRADWCVVRRTGRKIRLFAGRLIVLSLEKDRAWLATDIEQNVPEGLKHWEWDLDDYPVYKRPPSRNGYFTPIDEWQQEWKIVASSHFAYLKRALRKGVAPDHRSIAKHDVDLAKFIASTSLSMVVPTHRAFQLSQTSPGELLVTFQRETANLPRSTEIERLEIKRVGQDVFRKGLIDYWEGRCAITGLTVTELLRASHIKDWAVCETDAERLDVFNGLLLAPHLDAAFDRGFITIGEDGRVIVSPMLDADAGRLLGLGEPLRLRALGEEHQTYLAWHRREKFRGATST